MSQPAHKPARIDTIMMIDDSEIDQLVYRRIVSRSTIVGRLLQYTNAAAALQFLIENPSEMPDLILLDVNMPGMNGFDFLNRASAELDMQLCPVIVMLSTSVNPGDMARARSYEIVKDFYSKPLTQTMLDDLADLLATC